MLWDILSLWVHLWNCFCLLRAESYTVEILRWKYSVTVTAPSNWRMICISRWSWSRVRRTGGWRRPPNRCPPPSPARLLAPGVCGTTGGAQVSGPSWRDLNISGFVQNQKENFYVHKRWFISSFSNSFKFSWNFLFLNNTFSLTSRLKNDYRSGGSSSLPRIPKLSFSHHRSVPSTPAGESWQEGEGDILQRKDYMSSSSSVEEMVGAGSVIKKTRSRLSLNLGVFDSSPVRSPKIIPKFLRSSFSKLISKERTRKEQHLSPTSPTPSPPRPSPPTSPRSSPPSSPTTRSFVRESLAQGLPIIPFNYPTFVIVEKQRENKRLEGARAGESVSEPTSRKISEVSDGSEQAGQERSLNKLLVEAKKQLEIEKEAMKRKVGKSIVYTNDFAREWKE